LKDKKTATSTGCCGAATEIGKQQHRYSCLDDNNELRRCCNKKLAIFAVADSLCKAIAIAATTCCRCYHIPQLIVAIKHFLNFTAVIEVALHSTVAKTMAFLEAVATG